MEYSSEFTLLSLSRGQDSNQIGHPPIPIGNSMEINSFKLPNSISHSSDSLTKLPIITAPSSTSESPFDATKLSESISARDLIKALPNAVLSLQIDREVSEVKVGEVYRF